MAAELAQTNPKRKGAAPRVLPRTGDVLAGKYRVEHVIGEGGMGVVLAAHHILLDQRVAVKLLDADDTDDPEAVERLLEEARAVAKLQSEHVARVMDVATLDDGAPILVMEHLDGFDLSTMLRDRGPMAPAIVADYILQALDALAQAHAQGIIHRDLKPSNLFVTTRLDGSILIKVLDFGISKRTSVRRDPKPRANTLTGERHVLGSPPYMSPEQVRTPRDIDPRSDIWGLGVLMYELLCDRLPFEGEEVGELFAAILEAKPKPIGSLRRDFPPEFERVVARCLARDRDDRYADVGEMARALAPLAEVDTTALLARIEQTLALAKDSSRWDAREVISSQGRARVPTTPKRESLEDVSASANTLNQSASTHRSGRARWGTKQGLAVAAAVLLTTSVIVFAWTMGRRASEPPPESLASAPAETAPIASTPAPVVTAAPAAPSSSAIAVSPQTTITTEALDQTPLVSPEELPRVAAPSQGRVVAPRSPATAPAAPLPAPAHSHAKIPSALLDRE